MKTLTLSVICMCCIASLTFSQVPDVLWTRTYGWESVEKATSVGLSSDGGLVIGGYTNSIGEGEYDALLIKINSDGDVEWHHTYGYENSDYFNSVQQTNDGGYVLCGSTFNDTNNDDIFLVKTSSDGQEEWRQYFGGINYEYASSIKQTSDAGFIITGYRRNGIEDVDIFLVKTYSDGDVEWHRTLFHENCFMQHPDLQQTNDGGFILTGTTVIDDSCRIFLTKMFSDGETEWNRYFQNSTTSGSHAIQQTIDGGYIISAETYSDIEFDSDMWLIKTDPTGEEEWNRVYHGEGYKVGSEIKQTLDNGYIITGYAGTEFGGINLWLMKTDSEGETEWEYIPTDDRINKGVGIQILDDGEFIVVGNTKTEVPGDLDIWLARFGTVTSISESDSPIPSEYSLNQIYPNPFNSMTTISVGLPETSDLKLMVFNINGQRVSTVADRSYSAGTHSFTFNADEMSSGVYFVQAIVEGKLNRIQKVVLIR